MTTRAVWQPLAIVLIPALLLLGLMLTNAGKHPEVLAESPYTFWLVVSALGSVLVAAVLQRLLKTSFGFSECMVLLSLVVACVLLALLFTKNLAFRGPVGNVMGMLVLFYAMVGIVGGIVITAATKKMSWLLASGLSVVLLACAFYALLSNASHWGNF